MASNIEQSLVVTKQAELEDAIIVSGEIRLLANKMNSAGLMSNSDRDDITAVKTLWSDRDRAGSIVKILRDKVGINQDHFKKFIEMLKSNSAFSDILHVLGIKGAAKQSAEDREAKDMMDSPLPISSNGATIQSAARIVCDSDGSELELTLGLLTFVNGFKLMEKVASKWDIVAANLCLDNIENIRSEYSTDTKRAEKVFTTWLKDAPNLNEGKYPKSWQGLEDLLNDSELSQVAIDFFVALEK